MEKLAPVDVVIVSAGWAGMILIKGIATRICQAEDVFVSGINDSVDA